MQGLLRIPIPTSRAPPPSCLPGTAVARILFLFVPDSQSTLHSWLLGVFGISPFPLREALYLLPHVHPVPCCLVPATPPHLTPFQLQPAGGKGLPSEGSRPPPSPWWDHLTTVKRKHQEMGASLFPWNHLFPSFLVSFQTPHILALSSVSSCFLGFNLSHCSWAVSPPTVLELSVDSSSLTRLRVKTCYLLKRGLLCLGSTCVPFHQAECLGAPDIGKDLLFKQ